MKKMPMVLLLAVTALLGMSVDGTIVALASTKTPVKAATTTAKPKVLPTLDMVAVSFNQVDNNQFNFNAMPDPFDLNNGDVSGLSFELPTGHDYFWTLTHVENLTKGKHTVKIEIVNPKGQKVGTSSETFLSTNTSNGHNETTIWKDVSISSGYNAFKVYVDGTYIGQSLVWG